MRCARSSASIRISSSCSVFPSATSAPMRSQTCVAYRAPSWRSAFALSTSLVRLAAVLCAAVLAASLAFARDASPLPEGKPQALGLSAARLARMGDFYEQQVAQQVAAGYVLMIARNGRLAYAHAAGMRDREQKLPMTLDTRFR